MALIDRFSGGIVTGYNDMYLTPEFSTALVNVDISRRGLLSHKTAQAIMNNVKPFFYQYPVKEEFIRYAGTPDEETVLRYTEPYSTHVTSSDTRRSYAEFQGRLCYSDGGPTCKTTDGIIDPTTGDFSWQDMGVEAPDGPIVARVITVEDDIPTATVTLNVDNGGYINIPTVRYRVTDDVDTVYIHEIANNTGNATVDWVLPSTHKVYRELIDEYGDNTDVFVFVGSGTFTDGLTEINEGYEFTNTISTDDRSSYRLSLIGSNIYSVPYTVVNTPTETIVNITAIYSLVNNAWTSSSYSISQSIFIADAVAIASSFAYNGDLYVMVRVGNVTKIYDDSGAVVTSLGAISEEFFKGSTVEHVSTPAGDHTLYIFSPSEGKVAVFDGTNLTIKDTEVFPYATAQNSVYTIYNDTIYALLNDATEANIRSFTVPDLTLGYTGYSRIKIDKVQGLGGTSGCDLVEGDFHIFPVMKGIVSFSRVSNQVARQDNDAAVVTSDIRGYVYKSGLVHLVGGTDILTWKYVGSTFDYDILDVPMLTGTYVYNVSQLTGTGLDGPIMLTENNPVSVYKGHIKVDVSGVSYTTELRLYRTGGYLTLFKMVLDADPLPHDGYIDKVDDVSLALAREGLYSQVYSPPTGLNWLTAHRGLLFGSVDNRLYWSQPGVLDYWDPLVNVLFCDAPIYGLVSGANGLIIVMKESIALLLGYSSEDFELRTVTKDKGSDDSYGIQGVSGGAFLFTRDGLCFTDGISVEDVSYQPLGSIDFRTIDSCVTDRTYYALVENFTDSKYNKLVLTHNIAEDKVFSSLSGDQITSLGIVDGKVAHTYNEQLYDTLGGNALREMYYKSGNITMDSSTVVKEWDRVRLTGEFVGTFNVYIDGVLATTKVINTTITGRINFHIPKENNKGKAIQFEASGVGIIIGIEYSTTERKSTK